MTISLGIRSFTGVILAMSTLSGCMGLDQFGLGKSDVSAGQGDSAYVQASAKKESPTIDILKQRPSVLPSGSAYDQVAQSVLQASSQPAAAQLMAATLRSRAADKNWLPRLGPQISLDSLGNFVTSLVVDQVLFDNGRKKAERAFARADVEIAAVNLAIETNERVATALDLYLRSQEATSRAKAAKRALMQMREFDRIMSARVVGGVSDLSEQNVIRAKISELQAIYDTQLENANTSMAELKVMSATDVSHVTGTDVLPQENAGFEPLSVLLAQSELQRDVAQAKVDRASLLPSINTRAVLGDNEGGTISASTPTGFGFGSLDNLAAVKAARDGAQRRILRAREDSMRKQQSQKQKLISLKKRSAQSKNLVKQARANTNLFKRQFDGGQRTVMDVVGVVENLSRLEQEYVAVRYQIARTEVDIAREFGLLVDGSNI